MATQVITGRSTLRVLPVPPAIEVHELSRRFGDTVALDAISLTVMPGEVHALLGPNGAGKTVTLRTLTGLLAPTSGTVRIMGVDVALGRRSTCMLIGFVPAGDRTFYMRLSGLENLVFFARLYGLRAAEARTRALTVLDQVGLASRADSPIGTYSHGMQKRLSVARALLTNPSVLLVDEATHDLDPHAAASIRDLVAELARDGVAVLWTTQRIDEVRGCVDRVTLLREGKVGFAGSVNGLMAHAEARRFILRLGGGIDTSDALQLDRDLAGLAELRPLESSGGEHWLLTLNERRVLGEAIAALASAGVPVLGCHRERSEVEDAFVSLSGAGDS